MDHRTFGGRIYHSDFTKKATLAEIAERIASDRRFDLECRRNAEYRNRPEGEGKGGEANA